MNNYVLGRKLLDTFLNRLLEINYIENPEVTNLVHEYTYYLSTIHGNTYFLSKNIQSKINHADYPENYINDVYTFQEEKLFIIEEFNSDFIKFMLSHVSVPNIELDEHLNEIHEDLINSNYGKQIRY